MLSKKSSMKKGRFKRDIETAADTLVNMPASNGWTGPIVPPVPITRIVDIQEMQVPVNSPEAKI